MAALPPVAGPLWPPPPSGRAVFGGQCMHAAPDSCPTCDGTRADEQELWRDQRDRERANRRSRP